jgi:negative regulator of replication initiation
VFLKRLAASLDTVINQSIEHLRTLLSDPNLNKNRRAILTSHLSKMITQYKFDLVALNIATLEDSVRAHAQVTIDAKNELLLLDGDQPQSSTQEFVQAIETRQDNMKQRAEELLNHQLHTFFDQAPTEVDDTDDSVPVGATM